MCTGTFLGATGLAWLVLPAASLSYWTDKLWQTGRVGRTDSTVNKSLLGLLARQLPDGVPTTLVWLAVAAAVGALAYWRAARHLRDGSPLAAALAVGALSVAVSPISWPHHQLWLVLAACWYLLLGGRTATLAGAALFVVFLGYPWFDDYPAGTVGTLLGIGSNCPRWPSSSCWASACCPAAGGCPHPSPLPSMPRSWPRWLWLAALTGLAIGLVAAGILLRTLFGSGTGSSYGALHLADYEVYRGAVRSWLAGNGLYDHGVPDRGNRADAPVHVPAVRGAGDGTHRRDPRRQLPAGSGSCSRSPSARCSPCCSCGRRRCREDASPHVTGCRWSGRPGVAAQRAGHPQPLRRAAEYLRRLPRRSSTQAAISLPAGGASVSASRARSS